MINLLRFLRVELHPEYKHLKEFLTSMPLRFHNNEGKVIYKGRNELRVFEYQGQEYVVKSFKKPILINRIVYGILRPTKAKRSYNNALELLHIGICTPQPIGYVNVRNGLFLNESYLVTLKSLCPYTWNDLFNKKFSCEEQVARATGRLTAQLHNHQLAHKDYGRGNILFSFESENNVHLELVDLNRMHRGPIDLVHGCKNLERLPATPQMHRWIAEEYAQARGFDVEKCYELIRAYRSTQSGKIDGKY